MNYSIITIGTRSLQRSGLSSMTRYRVLNLSPPRKSYLVTASFANLGFFPNFSKQTLVCPESIFLNHVNKIIECTKNIPILVELDLSHNLENIDHRHWKRYLEQHGENYILNFCLRLAQIKNQTRIFSAKPRDIIILGQTVLFNPRLPLQTLIDLTDKINLNLQIAAVITKIPVVIPAGMIGPTGKISIPLLSVPRESIFNTDGSLSDYTMHQAICLVFLIIDGLKLLDDVTLEPHFRSHMVYQTT
jgi:hypothetical protein